MGRRVVLCDDDTVTRRVMAHLAREAGWEVAAETADGPSTLMVLAEAAPDVLVLDLALPGINGLEVARRARAQYPDVRILIVSAFEVTEEEAALAGADGALAKVDLADLVEKLEALVASGQSTRGSN